MESDGKKTETVSALDRARHKAYWRLLPLLFFCYVIAYVDRQNVAIAKLTMTKDLPGFDNAVIGFGAGIFFIGYFLLEIPGSLLVERWSARKWISRIMITWGFMAALTAFVKTPHQFYTVRFFLGLAEAGFFPGVIVYLTHWFPSRDRSRTLAYFLVATPTAQIISPKISNWILKIGTDEMVNGVMVHHPAWFGMQGWQWVYILWGIPSVILGVIVLFMLTDRPKHAKWLTTEEREALEQELAKEEAQKSRGRKRMTLAEALSHPQVLLMALAYFCMASGSSSLEFFLPSFLDSWYGLKIDTITWLVILPPLLALGGQLFVGWSSDRMKERRFHAIVPILIGAVALGMAAWTKGHLVLTVLCFMVAFTGFKSYMPAFWSMPSLFLSQSAAAGSIGLINSLGNLGGLFGPTMMGYVEKHTGSFVNGLYFLCGMMCVSATVIYCLNLEHKEEQGISTPQPETK